MLYKRSSKPGAVWWCKFSIRGETVRVSCRTSNKQAAQEYEQALREGAWREVTLGVEQHLWEECTERWLIEKSAKKSLQRDRDAFTALATKLDGLMLTDIDGKLIADCEAFLRAGVRKAERSPASVARMMATLRSVLNIAADKWHWLPTAPTVATPDMAKPETRWITQTQFDELFRQLPFHAAQIVRFMVATGFRSGNVFGLRWEHVDLAANVIRLPGAVLKGGAATGFPLSAEARTVIEQQRGAHREHVFCDHKGRAPIGSIKTCWKKACIRAGVPGLKIHHLRHSFAAWHKLAGTPDAALQALGGWSDPRMVQRYGQIAPTGFSDFADNRRLPNFSTKKDTREGGGE